MAKSILFIRADKIAIPDVDVYAFQSLCNVYNIQFNQFELNNASDITQALGGAYDYICFAGHGNLMGFGDQNYFTISWTVIGQIICQENSIKINGIVILFCCNGGLPQIGCQLIDICPNLDFVMGVSKIGKSIDLLMAYSIFIYNRELKNLSEIDSIHRAISGTGVQIAHYYKGDKDPETKEYRCLICDKMAGRLN
ncbi:MAG: hypothetical protein IPG12_04720 [Saprospiraceae bacterium]|nr:hypothetical protein [Saprospiraceae bacterium]